MTETNDDRRYAPAAARNRDAIADVLRGVVRGNEDVLEIASGSGEHVVHFAEMFPKAAFKPSDPDAGARSSIDAWVRQSGLTNVSSALELDVTAPPDLSPVDVVICINMIHIAPPDATRGLVQLAGNIIRSGGALFLYGPFKRDGAHTAHSNAAFDQSLRARDPRWGIRNLEDVVSLGMTAGFSAHDVIEMPANNLSVILRRA